MRLLRLSGYLFIVLLLATGIVLWMGSRLPAEHRSTASVIVDAPADKVWSLLADVQSQPRWRSGLKSVEMLSPQGGLPCWREVQTAMAMPLCVVSSQPPSLRVVRISDPRLPFGGTWTYTLEPLGATTRVTITEQGTTGPAMWRFFEHYGMGEESQIRKYLKDLGSAVQGAAGVAPR